MVFESRIMKIILNIPIFFCGGTCFIPIVRINREITAIAVVR